MRRATSASRLKGFPKQISIHALHEESDLHRPPFFGERVDISIHALHEESDAKVGMWRALYLVISIHALHEESDSISLQFRAV